MIRYLNIQGFKSIKEMELELMPVNVFIGSNGAGKSNLITFFKLLDALYARRFQRFVKEEKADNILYFGRKTTDNIYGKLIFSKDDINNNSFFFKIEQDNQGGLYIGEEGYGYNVDRSSDSLNYFTTGNLEEIEISLKTHLRHKYIKEYLSGIQIYHFHDTSTT